MNLTKKNTQPPQTGSFGFIASARQGSPKGTVALTQAGLLGGAVRPSTVLNTTNGGTLGDISAKLPSHARFKSVVSRSGATASSARKSIAATRPARRKLFGIF